mgnify:CR=1 FL=1
MQKLFDEVNSLDKRCYEKFLLSEDLLMEHAASNMALYISEKYSTSKSILIHSVSPHSFFRATNTPIEIKGSITINIFPKLKHKVIRIEVGNKTTLYKSNFLSILGEISPIIISTGIVGI